MAQSKQLMIRMDEELKSATEAMADMLDISVAAYIRMLINQDMKKRMR